MQILASAGAKNACRRGHVEVDGKRARTSDALHAGQCIALRARSTPANAVMHGHAGGLQPTDPRAPPLEVVWEDAHLAVVIKPQGVTTQGSGEARLMMLMVDGQALASSIMMHAVCL